MFVTAPALESNEWGVSVELWTSFIDSNTQFKENGDVCVWANESILFFIKCHLQRAVK